MNRATPPNTPTALWVWPLGKLYPAAPSRAASTMVKSGSRTQGRGARQTIADVDGANLAEAVKNAWSMAGAVGGMLLVCLFDNRLLQFPNRAPWWGQLIKLLGGLALVVLVKTLLKAPLLSLCGGHEAAHALRYFLMVLTAGILWPMTFPFFERYAR